MQMCVCGGGEHRQTADADCRVSKIPPPPFVPPGDLFVANDALQTTNGATTTHNPQPTTHHTYAKQPSAHIHVHSH